MRTLLFASLFLPFAALPAAAQDRPPAPPPNQRRLERAKAFVAARDKDGDGRLTAQELGVGKDLFALLDRNGDGFVTAEELAMGRPRGPRGGASPQGGNAAQQPPPPGPGKQGARGDSTALLQRIMKRLDKNGDGKLSKDEMPNRGRLDFNALDTNHDGFVDVAELAVGLSKMRAGRGAAGGSRMLRRFEEMDANKDGKIDKSEWKGPQKLFDRLDANHDGVITKEELAAAAARMARERGRGRAGETLFRRFDKNHDGKITRDEWPLRPQQFDKFDANKDGVITPDEVSTPVPPDAGSGQDAASFLARFDKNRDGVVSKEEFPNEARFSEMDADGNGVLTRQEIDAAMQRRVRERGFDFYAKYDLNGDGKVTRDEFTGPAVLFERMDRNHDGVIDSSDIPQKK